MYKKTVFVALCLVLIAVAMAQNTIHLQIKSLPPYHPSGSNIYAAGSFNGWNPQDENYRFQHDDSGIYSLDLKLDKGSYEYKITRGGWDKTECKKGGAGVANRILKIEA
ncbi:MAG TPA: hypothetical protein VJ111_05690, partial [Chitinophagaceae bacterium]|nr:hypothetical protein [Chitinophagaceae bacterium]